MQRSFSGELIIAKLQKVYKIRVPGRAVIPNMAADLCSVTPDPDFCYIALTFRRA